MPFESVEGKPSKQSARKDRSAAMVDAAPRKEGTTLKNLLQPPSRAASDRASSAFIDGSSDAAPTTLVEKRPVDAAAQSSTPPDSSDGTRSSKSSHA